MCVPCPHPDTPTSPSPPRPHALTTRTERRGGGRGWGKAAIAWLCGKTPKHCQLFPKSELLCDCTCFSFPPYTLCLDIFSTCDVYCKEAIINLLQILLVPGSPRLCVALLCPAPCLHSPGGCVGTHLCSVCVNSQHQIVTGNAVGTKGARNCVRARYGYGQWSRRIAGINEVLAENSGLDDKSSHQKSAWHTEGQQDGSRSKRTCR